MRTSYYTAALVALLAGLPAAALGQAPEQAPTVDYMIFLKGVPIGTEQVSVVRDQERTTITGSSRVGPPVSIVIRKVSLVYDAQWRPLEYTLDATVRDQWTTIYTRITGDTAVSDIRFVGQQESRTHRISPDAVLLPSQYFGSFEALAARLAGLQPGAEVRAYVVPQGEVGIKFVSASDEQLRTGPVLMGIRRYRIQIMNPGVPLDAEVWTDSAGSLLRYSAPAQTLDVVRSDIATVSTRHEAETRPNDEQAMIQAAGFNLASTLSKPVGFVPSKTNRLPAVVLVGSSGQTDRDEWVAGVPLFAQIASGLADAGFMVVRFDKRGVGQSGGRAEAATLADYADDVRAVVRFLDKRKDVDPKNISVLGHDEGGWIAMMAAAGEKKVASVVLAAAAGTSGTDWLLEQQREALNRMTLSEADKQAKIELQKRIQKAVLSGAGWEGIGSSVRDQADTPWFQSFLSFDPAARMKKVDQPVLVIQGELDKQVPPRHAELLRQAARARKANPRRTVDVVLVPGLNHLLVPAKTGEVDEYARLTDHTVGKEVVGAISGWLKKAARK